MNTVVLHNLDLSHASSLNSSALDKIIAVISDTRLISKDGLLFFFLCLFVCKHMMILYIHFLIKNAVSDNWHNPFGIHFEWFNFYSMYCVSYLQIYLSQSHNHFSTEYTSFQHKIRGIDRKNNNKKNNLLLNIDIFQLGRLNKEKIYFGMKKKLLG